MTTSSQVRWLSSLLLAGALVVSVASGARADGPLTSIGKRSAEREGARAGPSGQSRLRRHREGSHHSRHRDAGCPIVHPGRRRPSAKLPAFPSTLLKSQAVAVEGDYAYLAGAYLIVVDISNPALPDPVGKLAIPGGRWTSSSRTTSSMAYRSPGSCTSYARQRRDPPGAPPAPATLPRRSPGSSDCRHGPTPGPTWSISSGCAPPTGLPLVTSPP